jgi:3D (Asp-Asp-Asp) domain-containing protein
MTLLIARIDVFRQPSATGKSSPSKSPRRSGKLPYQRPQQFSIPAGNLVWLWTLFAAVLAITLPALLNNNFSLSTPASVDGQKATPLNEISLEAVFDAPATIRASRVPALEEDPLAPTSLSYQGNPSEGAKSLLGNENVALLNALKPARLELEYAVRFNLGSLRVQENLTSARNKANRKNGGAASRLARLTVYWPEEGDFYTRKRKSSTGIRLRDGHCAVDPKVIPYGSVVNVPGIGRLIAVDTGGAVVSRRAARLAGQTREQRSAIVIDVFCSTREKARALIKRVKHFAVVTWQGPDRVVVR